MLLEDDKKHNKFLYILLGGCFLAIFSSFYFFYFKKDYDFIIEMKCDSTKENCFYRDCSDPTNCPPNDLSYYSQYTIKARDFKYCGNEDCTVACATGLIKCVKTECIKDQANNNGDVCKTPDEASGSDAKS